MFLYKKVTIEEEGPAQVFTLIRNSVNFDVSHPEDVLT